MTTNLFRPMAQKGGFIASDIEHTMHAAGRSVMVATGARSYCLVLHPGFLASLAPAMAELPEASGDPRLAPFARDALLSAATDPDGPRSFELGAWTEAEDAQDGRILGRQLFGSGGELMGALALGFGAGDTIAVSRFDWPVRSVELLLESVCTKLVLELDLVAATRQAKRLKQIAETDGLTGLLNAAAFTEHATERVAADRGPVALILIDIDHFKRINDLYGHQFGDRHLQIVARSLRSTFPEGALLGRIGGDEFAVLVDVPKAGVSYVEALMTRCSTAMQRTSAMMGKSELGRISLGASLYPTHAKSFRELFEQADASLYASKNSGRGTQSFYDPAHGLRIQTSNLGARLNAAIAEDRIRPYFQPIADLETGACLGFEALARWDDPEVGLLPPEAFAGVLSDHSMAEALTRHLASRALREFATAAEAFASRGGGPLTLSVNLTEFDLRNPEFVFDLQQAMTENGVDWPALVIEVSENTMLGAEYGQVFRTLNELRIRGAQVALDDFGTGYGGLKHLSDWPVDILKIDRHFVASLTDGPTERAVVAAILAIAGRSGFATIAEGIETPEQLAMLRELGCRRGQGFLFSGALPPEELAASPARYRVASSSGDGGAACAQRS